MRYAYFPGCQVLSRLVQYDLSTRNVARKLGISLVDLAGAGCCGPVSIRSIDYKASLALATRVLALAEREKLDLVTICNGCYESFTEANLMLHEYPELRSEINSILDSAENLTYESDVQVKHFIQVLYQDLGLEKITGLIKKRFEGLNVAVQYGCHVLRPSKNLKFDIAEDPKIVDQLVEATGAKSIYWPLKLWCCGAVSLAVDENIPLPRMKLIDAKQSGAHCFVTICPSCQIQLDNLQPRLAKIFNERYDLPSMLYPQMLGLALGLAPHDVGLDLNRVSAVTLLEHLE